MKEGIRITGLDEITKFLDELDRFQKATSDPLAVQDILMTGATALRDDVRKLPRPRSNMHKRTHMLDLVDAQAKGKDTAQVGWTNDGYYGVFVERGTKKLHKTTPHIGPTWDKNKTRYYKLMAQKLFQKGGL
jgi:HK97 gp10 family phage protein